MLCVVRGPVVAVKKVAGNLRERIEKEVRVDEVGKIRQSYMAFFSDMGILSLS